MKSRLALVVALLGAVASVGAGPGVGATPPTTQCAPVANYPAATTPVAFWSTEARCAIVPAGPGGIFGSENFGTKFPGEAAVLMGIVHVAIYDAAVAIEGGYQPYAATPTAPADTSPEAAIATAAYDTLTGLQPQLGANQTILDGDHTAYLAAIPDGTAKAQRDRDRRAGRASRARAARERRPWVQHHAPGPPPACAGPRRLATRARSGARPLPARDATARAEAAPRSSDPTAPTH